MVSTNPLFRYFKPPTAIPPLFPSPALLQIFNSWWFQRTSLDSRQALLHPVHPQTANLNQTLIMPSKPNLTISHSERSHWINTSIRFYITPLKFLEFYASIKTSSLPIFHFKTPTGCISRSPYGCNNVYGWKVKNFENKESRSVNYHQSQFNNLPTHDLYDPSISSLPHTAKSYLFPFSHYTTLKSLQSSKFSTKLWIYSQQSLKYFS